MSKLKLEFDVALIRQALIDQHRVDLMMIDSINQLKSFQTDADDLKFLKALDHSKAPGLLDIMHKSTSQIRQDLFVLAELDFKQGGYFVDFGATNGKDLSNSYLLETEFEWTGICAEPARIWHEDIRQNRSAYIDFDCVWTTTGEELVFNEVAAPEFSTLATFNDRDMHAETRKHGTDYKVKTVSLNDLLSRYQAPKEMDYLSIDTEGSELDILQSFDFETYSFKVITCEHNYTEDRDRIFELLTSKGYERKLEPFSHFDDWYVKR